MENTKTLSQFASSIVTPSVMERFVEKLSGENITIIIVTAIAAKTICYVCNSGGGLEIAFGDKKVVLNKFDKAA